MKKNPLKALTLKQINFKKKKGYAEEDLRGACARMWKRGGSRETRRYRRRAIVRHDLTVSTYVFLSLRSMTLACEERISRAREFQE